ncbi:MAG: alpha/beta hydrolase [Pirellulales bacterium]
MTSNLSDAQILDHPAVSGCYLFPQDRCVRNPWNVEVSGATLACCRRIVDPAALTLVHFHGNGEAVADYIPEWADALAAMRINSLFVEYREYGDSTGCAQLVAMLGDGEAVLEAAGLAPENVVAFGRSIGSLYAIELAARRPQLAGLVLESGIADPAERFLKYADFSQAPFTRDDVRAAAHRCFHHERKLASYRGPLLVLHADHDHLVDASHAERNFRWCGSDRKKLVRFPVGDHNSIHHYNYDEYQRELRDFLQR